MRRLFGSLSIKFYLKMDKNVLYSVVASLLNAAYGHETKVAHS
jgi:hypothetical protein